MRAKNFCGGDLASPVNVTNDSQMIREGLRVPNLSFNPEVFKHTEEDKLLLKKLKREWGNKSVKPLSQKVHRESNHKLVVYMDKSPRVKNFKSTHSFVCTESEIGEVLMSLVELGYSLKKVYFNNKLVA